MAMHPRLPAALPALCTAARYSVSNHDEEVRRGIAQPQGVAHFGMRLTYQSFEQVGRCLDDDALDLGYNRDVKVSAMSSSAQHHETLLANKSASCCTPVLSTRGDGMERAANN